MQLRKVILGGVALVVALAVVTVPALAWHATVEESESCEGWALIVDIDPNGQGWTGDVVYDPAQSGDWSGGDSVAWTVTVNYDNGETKVYSGTVNKPDNCTPTPTSTATETPVATPTPPRGDFNLTSMCKPSEQEGQLRVRNNSPVSQGFTIDWVGVQNAYISDTAPVGDSFYTVPWTASNNTWRLNIAGYQIVKAIGNNPLCASPTPTETAVPSDTPTSTATLEPEVTPTETPDPTATATPPPDGEEDRAGPANTRGTLLAWLATGIAALGGMLAIGRYLLIRRAA